MTDAERAVIQTLVDDGLEQFVQDVAAGRNLDIDQVRAIADGRILTGRQALELGLIDGFGGLEEAVDLAAELAGIEKPHVQRFERRTPWYSRLFATMLLRLTNTLPPANGLPGDPWSLIDGPVPNIELNY